MSGERGLEVGFAVADENGVGSVGRAEAERTLDRVGGGLEWKHRVASDDCANDAGDTVALQPSRDSARGIRGNDGDRAGIGEQAQ